MLKVIDCNINQYDLVRVKKFNHPKFIDALGIVADIHYDKMYELIFVGRELNEISIANGRFLFVEDELELV